MNSADRDRRTALHHAIRSPTTAPAARARTAQALLEGWAVPELRDVDRQSAYQAAKSTGCDLLQKVLAEHGLAHGPRQSREARARNIRDERLQAGREFPFEQLVGASAGARFYGFEEPANWDY